MGEGGELLRVEAAEEDGHEEGGDLGVGDEVVFGVRWTTAWMKAWISSSERARPSRLWRMTSMGWMVVFMRCYWVRCEEEGGGEEVGDGGLGEVPSSPGKKTTVSGVLNSWMVWRQAPQGWLAVSLRLATAMARMRISGPWRLTAAAMAVCSAQTVRR